MENFKIGRFTIGPGQPALIVAEMSGNHGGSIEKAFEIIAAAKEAGADAVKLQTYTADTITLDCDKPDFKLPPGPWEDHKNLYSLYQKGFTPWEWHERLFEYARSLGLEIFSSPFDHTAVDFLEKFDPCAYKLASPEITDVPLLEKMARTGKPIILSTGIATLEDIELAVKVLKENNCNKFIILKCTTAYPAPIDEANLRTMVDIKERFNCFVGLSDHTLGLTVPTVAASLGAVLIEKHFTTNKAEETVDSFFSLDKQEFSELVVRIREVELCLGSTNYDLTEKAKANIKGRRSLYISNSIKKGEVLSPSNVKSVRPSLGLHPKYYSEILGRRVNQDLEVGDRLSFDLLE